MCTFHISYVRHSMIQQILSRASFDRKLFRTVSIEVCNNVNLQFVQKYVGTYNSKQSFQVEKFILYTAYGYGTAYVKI